MELKDLFLAPISLMMLYALAYWIRPKVTNTLTKKYFIPALTVKLLGAIALGLLYQYYYGGGEPSGDTFNYFKQSKFIYDAFYHSYSAGWKLLLANGEFDPDTRLFAARIYWYHAPTEYFIVKLAGFFGLFCFHTYTVIGLFFAAASFSGMWAIYQTFLKIYPGLYKQFAIAVFFLPSVVFWGSGLLKDSITLGALGWLFYGFYTFFVEKKNLFKSAIIIFLAAYVIYNVKVYILLSFLSPALFWVFNENSNRIRSIFLRRLAKPIFIGLGLAVAYMGAITITKGDKRYSLDKITETSRINTIYLTEQVQTGSAYNIGIFDGSFSSFIKVGPQAIIVALYRPFLWDVRNPIMLLSAIEATIFIFFTLKFFFRTGFFKTIRLISATPILTFCMVFCLIFAFGVGTSSGNFGTLVRYKIPLMPFYLAALYIMQAHAKRPKKLVRLAATA